MTTGDMIRELRRLEEARRDDFVGVGETNWASMCHDVANRLEELAKAQEPVEPILDIDEWKCGNCGHALEHQELLGDNVLFHEHYNYCPECGRMTKWDVDA